MTYDSPKVVTWGREGSKSEGKKVSSFMDSPYLTLPYFYFQKETLFKFSYKFELNISARSRFYNILRYTYQTFELFLK